MIGTEIFLMGLLITSTLTGLATEAFKKVFTEHKRPVYANTLAGIISVILSASIGAGYVCAKGIGFEMPTIISIIALVFMSWLCAMLGYDKVIQTISQFKTTREEDTHE